MRRCRRVERSILWSGISSIVIFWEHESSGSRRRRRRRSVEDFPLVIVSFCYWVTKVGSIYLPLRPHIATFSPGWMDMLRPFSARDDFSSLIVLKYTLAHLYNRRHQEKSYLYEAET